MDDGLRMVEVGACSAWPLPGDPTCAGVARRIYRRAAAGLALDPSLVDDGVLMVSELAANTLHAQDEQDEEQQPGPPRSAPELWLYLRGSGPRVELVCKIFDSFPGWLRGNVPGRGVGQAPADAVSGRGLEVVHELSNGHWGHHLTRSRLAGWEVRGKAVWFAVPAIVPQTVPAGTSGTDSAALPGGTAAAGAPSATPPQTAPAPASGTARTHANGIAYNPENGTTPAPANGTAPAPAPANGTAPAPANGTPAALASGSASPAVPDTTQPPANGTAPPHAPQNAQSAAQPAAPQSVAVPRSATPDRYAVMPAGQAMTELESGLAARGFSGKMVRADDPAADMAVLSVCTGVTVWCRAGVAWLRAPGLTGQRWSFYDLVEVAEQTVQAFETLAVKGELPQLAEATRTGALRRVPPLERTTPDRANPGQRRATRRCASPAPRSGPR
jgi:hypothetical protein